jgi:hypothetical protein
MDGYLHVVGLDIVMSCPRCLKTWHGYTVEGHLQEAQV